MDSIFDAMTQKTQTILIFHLKFINVSVLYATSAEAVDDSLKEKKIKQVKLNKLHYTVTI